MLSLLALCFLSFDVFRDLFVISLSVVQSCGVLDVFQLVTLLISAFGVAYTHYSTHGHEFQFFALWLAVRVATCFLTSADQLCSFHVVY